MHQPYLSIYRNFQNVPSGFLKCVSIVLLGWPQLSAGQSLNFLLDAAEGAVVLLKKRCGDSLISRGSTSELLLYP